MIDKQVPIINQTVTGFAEYDIDGDFERWLYKREDRFSKDSSLKSPSICGNPIKYSQSVTGFISSKGFDSSGIFLYIQSGRKGLDSLTNYTSSRKFIDCKYRPNSNSYFWNLLFKKRMAVALSKIVFNTAKDVAVIKMWYYSRSQMHKDNPSKIMVYNKNSLGWALLGIINEME